MTTPEPDAEARRLARESLAADDPTGWFERLYAAAEQGAAVVPWDRGTPHPMLVDWARARGLDGRGGRALVVGFGPGHDAEFVSSLGFTTTAFDIAESAVRAARERFPDSTVRYLTADLLAPPPEWYGAYDLVVESLTVQSLPDAFRPDAIRQVARLVAPGGTLLVIAAAREESEPAVGQPPWPLTRAEVEAFAHDGLEVVRIDDLYDADRQVRRWRAEFSGPAA
ncbi:class I SAM-dependent methyltransferase [Actinopolymorpha sp. B17G11]|uniref:class I SAM-dependent methyltransferase n=1 Tax=unclassified Actinopolymorpha TaxID=2627063 RepID=UPI0032D9844C